MNEQGALSSQEIDDGGQRAVHVWGSSATLAKSTLQKLFFHGRVLIAQRQGNRRYYDLPERVLPAATSSAMSATAEETQRWLALTKLRQRRLCTLTTKEHRLLEDKVLPVTLSDVDVRRLFILKADEALLETSQSDSKPLLLAPLDPLLYDRKVTEALWSYHYRWEVYTPPHKRVRGYYALPLLSGIEIVDHVEGQWLFTPHGTGTLVTWRWTLHPRSALSAPALPMFARIWRGYARQALETLSGHLVG